MRNILHLTCVGTLLSTTMLSAAYAEDKTTLDTVLVTTTEESDNETIAQDSAVTKSNMAIVDTARSISVVTEQRSRDRGANTIQDTLLYSAGVYGGAYGDDTRGDWSLIRGRAPQNYIDGLKSSFGYYNNSRPHLYSFDKTEILKGPASVEYGQGTVGGVVNLSSKLPEKETSREVFAEYGSFNHKEIGADFTGSIDEKGQFLYRLNAVVRDSDHQTNFVSDDRISVNPSFTWNASEATSVTACGSIGI